MPQIYESLARKVSFHRSRKTLTQHFSSLFPLFYVRVANHFTLKGLKELLHYLTPRNGEKLSFINKGR